MSTDYYLQCERCKKNIMAYWHNSGNQYFLAPSSELLEFLKLHRKDDGCIGKLVVLDEHAIEDFNND